MKNFYLNNYHTTKYFWHWVVFSHLLLLLLSGFSLPSTKHISPMVVEMRGSSFTSSMPLLPGKTSDQLAPLTVESSPALLEEPVASTSELASEKEELSSEVIIEETPVEEVITVEAEVVPEPEVKVAETKAQKPIEKLEKPAEKVTKPIKETKAIDRKEDKVPPKKITQKKLPEKKTEINKKSSKGSNNVQSKSAKNTEGASGGISSSRLKEVSNLLRSSGGGSGDLDAELGQLQASDRMMNDAISHIKQHIAVFWVLPSLPPKGSYVTFQIRLNQKGELLSAKKIASSGSNLLDEAASLAIEAASPFPMPADSNARALFLDWELTLKPEELQ